MTLDCFKAYDIRGRVGDMLTPDIAHRIGGAVVAVLGAKTVALGHDARESSPALAGALIEGLTGAGADVTDIGLCATEEVYLATAHLDAGAGLMVTASHNPADQNGIKIVGPGSRPLDPETEFAALRQAASALPLPVDRPGVVTRVETRPAYAAHLASCADAASIGPLKILADAGHGVAGMAFDAVAAALAEAGARLDVIRHRFAPLADPPDGMANPSLPHHRAEASRVMRASGAGLGIAWDSDGDRCVVFDETGAVVPGEILTALLAREALVRAQGSTILHDRRAVWAIEDTVRAAGGQPNATAAGHVHFKAAMRATGAAYGGELSGHHYFREVFCCDSGMLPWIRLAEIMSRTRRPLSALVAELTVRFASSGEINFAIADPEAVIEAVAAHFASQRPATDREDGLSLDFGLWRINLRASRTEDLLRLNVETRGDQSALERHVREVSALIEKSGGQQDS